MDDYYCGDDLTLEKRRRKKGRRRREKFRKKKKREKKIIATKNPSSSLISTHTSSRKRYANALSPSLSRKSRSVSFPRFLDARKRAVFLAFFFARDTHRTLSRERKGGGGSITRAKRTKKTTIIASKCVLARKIIAPTGPRATRLGDSTRAKRAERMRSNPFLSRSVSTVVAKWVGAGVRRSVVVVKRRR